MVQKVQSYKMFNGTKRLMLQNINGTKRKMLQTNVTKCLMLQNIDWYKTLNGTKR